MNLAAVMCVMQEQMGKDEMARHALRPPIHTVVDKIVVQAMSYDVIYDAEKALILPRPFRGQG